MSSRTEKTTRICSGKPNDGQKNRQRGKLSYPVLLIDVFVGVPLPRQKRILLADYFPVKERGKRGVLFRQSVDLQIPAEIRVFFVYVLQEKLSNFPPI
jgi:hypothetical protein